MATRIRKGDTVVVIAGDDKGTAAKPKTGRVLSVDEVKQRVVVEGVNLVRRHQKARSSKVQSGIIEKEAPVHISNVMLWDAKAGRGSRIGMRVNRSGERERVSRASGEVIPKPEKA
ncbi:MAG: 50S ribosomal protein L24 [Candidatus Eisenbacteria bacterium]|uniref:Large ribosomal subunit protein uL24 n=1 Tax=Eiseniibacteriota bacterium TaxID=2212470 RepID=A0A849SR00_UNCEI|nr:50S ribosomal protein L24 [Candidatus Eisenbacteria bacterium]